MSEAKDMTPEDHIRAAITGLRKRADTALTENQTMMNNAIDSGSPLSSPEFLGRQGENLMYGAVAAAAIGDLNKVLQILDRGLPGLTHYPSPEQRRY